jgi:hypothetical protein
MGVCCYTSLPKTGSGHGEKLVPCPVLKIFTLNRKDRLEIAVRFRLGLKGLIFTIDKTNTQKNSHNWKNTNFQE